MKITDVTVSFLKNFSSINNSILVRAGSKLSTISPTKSILASATVTEEFPTDFAIYDLSQFLGVLSLFKDPELEFHEQYVTISSGEEKVNYRYADPKLIITPPTKALNFPDPNVTFELTADALARIQKAGAALGVPEVAIVGEDEVITVRALNSKETEGNNYQFKVGETDIAFRAVFKTENLKLMADDYKVEVSERGLAKFSSARAEYFVAIESAASKF